MIQLNSKKVIFEKYPNGETRLVEPEILSNIFLVDFRYEDDSDLIKLLILKNYLDENSNSKKILTITHMPYARMDRAPIGKAFSLKYIAKIINLLNFDRVFVCDPHSDVTTALLDNCNEVSVMDVLVPIVMDRWFSDKTRYLVFPDSGAQKKYERFIQKDVPYFVGIKNRNFNNGKIESLEVVQIGEGKIETNSTAMIIDDLCSYGGTFAWTADVLKEKFNFSTVALTVAHCESSATEKNLFKSVDWVYTTDSMVGKEAIRLVRFKQKDLI